MIPKQITAPVQTTHIPDQIEPDRRILHFKPKDVPSWRRSRDPHGGYVTASGLSAPSCFNPTHGSECGMSVWMKDIIQGWLYTMQSNNSALPAEVHQSTLHSSRVPGRVDPPICVQLDPFIIYTWNDNDIMCVQLHYLHPHSIQLNSCHKMRWKRIRLQDLHANYSQMWGFSACVI